MWFKKQKVEETPPPPPAKPRTPDKLILGKYHFAEWVEEDEQEFRQGWRIYKVTPETAKHLFSVDSEDSAIKLMNLLDTLTHVELTKEIKK